jgi:hypothetical protein
MSLYQMLFGENPFARELKLMLALDEPAPDFPPPQKVLEAAEQWDEEMIQQVVEKAKKACFYPLGRFRDISINAEGDRIELLTRNNEGSGKAWVNEILRSHPCYLRDLEIPGQSEPDYIAMEFKVPETPEDFHYGVVRAEIVETELGMGLSDWIKATIKSFRKRAKEIADLSDNTSVTVKFNNLLKDMNANKRTPFTEHAAKVGKQIIETMLEGPDGVRTIDGPGGGVVVGRFSKGVDTTEEK